jgi:hypothetical protein
MKWLKRNEIDEARWNDLIATHPSGIPYAYTWYLDAVCKEWRALVYGDYVAVMPLPIAKKWGIIPFVYQPDFCQQLGVFSLEKSDTISQQFYDEVRMKFWFYHIQHNSYNALKKLLPKVNFELSLHADYESIYKLFGQSHKRNIQKAIKTDLVFGETTDIARFMAFYKENTKDVKAQIEDIAMVLQQRSKLKLFVVYSATNEPIAMNLMIDNGKRLIHLVPVITDKGRKTGAMHYLISEVINRYAHSDKLLDFEGSSISSIARFYKDFGAEERFFYEVKRRL